MKGVPCFFGGRGPGLGAFRIIAAGWIKPIDAGEPGRTMENGVSQADSIKSWCFLGGKIFLVEQNSCPACAKGSAVVHVIFGWDQEPAVVVGVNVNSNSDLL